MKLVRYMAIPILVLSIISLAPAQAKTLKIATMAPQDSPWFEVLSEIALRWEAASGGEIETKIYASGIAGDEFDVVRKMRVGQLDAALLSIGSLPEISQQFRALQMPLLIQSYDELDYVMAGIGPQLEASLGEQGFRVLAWGDAGWVRFFSARPVVSPDDLKQLRLFVWGSNNPYVDAWKDAGFNPVPVPAPEIHTALSTGLIEAIVVPPIAALSFQWFGIVNQMTELRWAPMIGAMVISERGWRKVPKEIRTEFQEIAATESRNAKDRIRGLEPQVIAAMQAHGLVTHDVPDAVFEEWQARVKTGFAPLIGTVVPPRLLARIQQLVADHRAARAQQ
jgi:TRAP-type transport system periplasmic protein